MPSYWKPLLPAHGVPLVCKIYEQVRPHVQRTFVVVAPDNAKQVAEVMPKDDDVFIVIQPEANGPGNALLFGMALTTQAQVLAVMGDNLMPDDDVKRVCDAALTSGFVIGTGEAQTITEAVRFTRIHQTDELTVIEEGKDIGWIPGPPFTVWCGPLVLPVERMQTALLTGKTYGEKKIGPYLEHLGRPTLVACEAIDVGTPETVLEVQA
jgi:bifunctional N-acetylglucosamine-1-phosphate-uridyltransferase/glucosamine-1-phosphate-acetyltransferase GlmU-like protein